MAESPVKPFAFDPRLESLRGIAALWVAIHHGLTTYVASRPAKFGETVLHDLLEPMNPSGSVMLFFVLSGYVVGQGFLRNLDLPAYAIRRTFRLLPPFVASLLFALGAVVLAGPITNTSSMSPFYIGAFGTQFGPHDLWDNLIFRSTRLNGPTWSIYPEIVGSAILPFLVLLHARMNPMWRWVVFFTVSTALAFSQLRYMIWFYGGFFLVAELAGAIGSRKIVACVSFALGLVVLAYASQHAVFYKTATIVPSTVGATLMIGAIVSQSDFMSWLEWRPIRFLGRVSYSFYLLHWPVFYICSVAVVRHADLFGAGFEANVIIMLTSTTAAIALAALSYRYVERPFIDLGRRLAAHSPRLAPHRSEAS